MINKEIMNGNKKQKRKIASLNAIYENLDQMYSAFNKTERTLFSLSC